MDGENPAGAALDVVGIGNAIVDVLSACDDAVLAKNGVAKGAMTLVDEPRADDLYKAMGPAQESSGGSAGNTLAGIASLGGRGGYIGRVRDDSFGKIFHHDITAAGVEFNNAPLSEGPSTARCLIFVTPDAERSMSTYLGACVNLNKDDILDDMVRTAAVTYLEGYLFDAEPAKRAFVHAAEIAHAAGRKTALTLSDSFCVERHRESFRHLIRHHIDILFANEAEIKSLYETESLEDAVGALRQDCSLSAVTFGERGSVIIAEGRDAVWVDAKPPEKVVDTTGAGDLYAAGFLFGYTQGLALERCGEIASLAAAEVIGHFGGRPLVNLKALL